MDNTYESSIGILKPSFTKYEKLSKQFLEMNSVTISISRPIQLNSADVKALYPEIYCSREDDEIFGVIWKEDMLNYLTSGLSHIIVVSGFNAQYLMQELRKKLRKREGKDAHPSTLLSREEFIEVAIKNVMHVVDVKDFQRALSILKLEDIKGAYNE